MAILAQLLNHYDRNVIPNCPKEFADRYRSIRVLCRDSTFALVEIKKYRMNVADPPHFSLSGRISDSTADEELRNAARTFEAYLLSSLSNPGTEIRALERLRVLGVMTSNNRVGPRFRRVFTGKGSPRDISLVLSLLDLSGYFQARVPKQSAMQDCCDRSVGLDCSGFVNNYFSALGRRDDDLTDRPTIATYARRDRRQIAIPGLPRNHVFCWVRGESRTGSRPGQVINFAHILVIDEWVNPPDPLTNNPVGAQFRATQSSASLGGICTEVYQILSSPSSGVRSRTWRIERINGRGNATFQPPEVWSDVFLAPPL